MKPDTPVNLDSIARRLARHASLAGSALALAVAASSALGADIPLPQVHESGNVAYVSGGVSKEARDALQPMAHDFNLKMVFATRTGEYLSDVQVTVTGARGGQPVLETKSNGPWFFARLPGGQYTVTASSNGRVQKRNVSVGTSGLKTVDFRWSEIDGDGVPRTASAATERR